ncbi:MAG: 3-isopropylmalate dehydratase [candidate division NC10 bacterium RIFCSPLOWO2_12_FULL_66_18]|nr:MAG: 3-isopropylmalate dehydratase [candidate division NC10 bacterium RIFCSPLOWO2_02_FULL_66_22]OGB99886.1 MAG: 3-isopropylmalate dehydratase [candidate division NC10 bacterium RIFCSPLOWO2_12_FULL_66_18]
MVIQGCARRLGDNINTDYIIASRYKTRMADLASLTPHLFEDADPGLAARIRPGDLLVAGRNFGGGSSRETAARLILQAGLRAVLALSFSRIFFRNAINVGLPAIECDTTGMAEDDVLVVDLAAGRIENRTRGRILPFAPLPAVVREILQDGGLAAHFQRHGGFRIT